MNKDDLKFLLVRLSERPIAFHPIFARVFGGVNEALYLQQLIFWGDKGIRPDGFIYKTKNEIENETTLTPKQQDRVRKPLVDSGVLKIKKERVNGAPTLHYKVDIGKVHSVILEKCKKDVSSISENTSEKASALQEADVVSPPKEAATAVVKIVAYFKKECGRRFGHPPLTGIKEVQRIKYALNTGGLTEAQVMDLLDEWLESNRPDEEIVQMGRALTINQLNAYKVRNL